MIRPKSQSHANRTHWSVISYKFLFFLLYENSGEDCGSVQLDRFSCHKTSNKIYCSNHALLKLLMMHFRFHFSNINIIFATNLKYIALAVKGSGLRCYSNGPVFGYIKSLEKTKELIQSSVSAYSPIQLHSKFWISASDDLPPP